MILDTKKNENSDPEGSTIHFTHEEKSVLLYPVFSKKVQSEINQLETLYDEKCEKIPSKTIFLEYKQYTCMQESNMQVVNQSILSYPISV